MVPRTICRFRFRRVELHRPGDGLHELGIGEELPGGLGAVGIEAADDHNHVAGRRVANAGDQGVVLQLGTIGLPGPGPGLIGAPTPGSREPDSFASRI